MNIINIKDKNLFYIGGIVRDEILGRESLDVDITYVGNAIEYCSRFGEVIQENPDFGTVRVSCHPEAFAEGSHNYEILRIAQNDNIIVDFASTRSEKYPRKGHLPVVDKIGCSLKEDVMRRDFTINSLAKSTLTGEIIDYTGGLEDLKNKKLRVLHNKSFIDDPTRIIRGLKFSVRLGFELDEHTKHLQDEYLSAINYDMSYKRVKKELIETLNSQAAFEKFINEGIYKLVTKNEVKLPSINIENLIDKYLKTYDNCWLIYAGVLRDLSLLPLTKNEQKILHDVPTKPLKTDFEIYKAFENVKLETILLYAILNSEEIALKYLNTLRYIKVEITGDDLKRAGIKPSPEYQRIFDEVLKQKLKNPAMTKKDEIDFIKKITAF